MSCFDGLVKLIENSWMKDLENSFTFFYSSSFGILLYSYAGFVKLIENSWMRDLDNSFTFFYVSPFGILLHSSALMHSPFSL